MTHRCVRILAFLIYVKMMHRSFTTISETITAACVHTLMNVHADPNTCICVVSRVVILCHYLISPAATHLCNYSKNKHRKKMYGIC